MTISLATYVLVFIMCIAIVTAWHYGNKAGELEEKLREVEGKYILLKSTKCQLEQTLADVDLIYKKAINQYVPKEVMEEMFNDTNFFETTKTIEIKPRIR